MTTIAVSYWPGISTVWVIFRDVCKALWKHMMPVTMQQLRLNEWKLIAKNFITDGCFQTVWVPLMVNMLLPSPANSGSLFYKYRGSFSIVLMAIMSADYHFVMVDIWAYGSTSDGEYLMLHFSTES